MDRRNLMRWMAGAAAAPVLAGCSRPLANVNVGTIVFPGYEFLQRPRDPAGRDAFQYR